MNLNTGYFSETVELKYIFMLRKMENRHRISRSVDQKKGIKKKKVIIIKYILSPQIINMIIVPHIGKMLLVFRKNHG